MSSPPLNLRAVPTYQAGGGAPSSATYHREVHSLTPPVLSHLEKAFKNLSRGGSSGGNDGMDQNPLLTFLEKVQQEPAQKAEGSSSMGGNALDSFFAYMSSSAASAMAPPIKHDLSHPISSYFISSSHNTYLTGNQLYSEASTDPYKNALLRGCRCLEIDIWDGESRSTSSASSSDVETGYTQKLGPSRGAGQGSKVSGHYDKMKQRARSASNPLKGTSPLNPQKTAVSTPPAVASEMPTPWTAASEEERPEPRVLHGYTLTKEVSFRAVCNAIRESAFVATDLPVIVSLEVHAGLEQQEVMIEIMKEAWKGMLVDIAEASRKPVNHLPSPDSLRKKILIKVKWTSAPTGQDFNDPGGQVTPASSGDEESGTDGERKKPAKILPTLSQLGFYTRAYTFKQFHQPEASIPTHVFSLSEAKVVDMLESHGHALISHNRDYLMRAYPSGMRVNSSNLEPLFLWSQGVQIAALNWQKWDKGMMLNEGMFAGQEGWVLKPEGYRGTRKGSDARKTVRKSTLSLTIELCAGQNLPLPSDEKVAKKFHPYVKCDLLYGSAGVESQGSMKDSKKYKWVSKTSKGVDPDFGGEVFHFSNVPNVVEELAFVRIKVKDDNLGKDTLAAWACFRLDRLKCGYRFVHLLDARGMESSGVLLVKIAKLFS